MALDEIFRYFVCPFIGAEKQLHKMCNCFSFFVVF